MDKFDDFISNEMLAAYIDGNAIPIEQNIIGEHMENEELQELFDIISDIKANPELIDAGECIDAEIPDKMFEGMEDTLQELKHNIEETNDSTIM